MLNWGRVIANTKSGNILVCFYSNEILCVGQMQRFDYAFCYNSFDNTRKLGTDVELTIKISKHFDWD